MNIQEIKDKREKLVKIKQETKALYDLAEESLANNDIEKAKEYEAIGDAKNQEAEELKAELEAATRLSQKREDLKKGRLPVQFPVEADTGTAEDDDAGGDEVSSSIKNIYRLRFQNEDEAVVAVLKDLHGKNYEAERLAQFDAFVRYLRRYNDIPSADDERLLKQIVIGPAQASSAIRNGLSVKAMKATMLEAVEELGGYVVPVDFQEEVIRRLMGFTVMRGRAMVTQTTRDRVELPKLTGGDTQYTTAVRVTWVNEEPTAGTADTNLTWGQVQIPVHTVMAETYLSRNLLEDAGVDIVAELSNAYGEAQGIDEDNKFLVGTGAGVPQGILIGGTSPVTGVTTVNSGSATTLTSDGIIQLQYGIASQYRSRAVWIVERQTASLIRRFKDGQGQYLWQPSMQEGQPDMLLGRPLLEQEIMPTVAAGTYPILFGDPTGYRIVERIGMTVERYLGGEEARRNRVLYIMRRRLGGQLSNPERWAVQLVSA